MGQRFDSWFGEEGGESVGGVARRDWCVRHVHIGVKRRYADGRLRSTGLGDMSTCLGPEGRRTQRDLNEPPPGYEVNQLLSLIPPSNKLTDCAERVGC